MNDFNVDNVIKSDSKELIEKLQKGVKKVYTSENYIKYLSFMNSLRRYSYNNQLLLYFQAKERGINPTAFAGFSTWAKLDVRVKKGEKAFAVISPVIKKVPVKIKKMAVDDVLTPTDESTDVTVDNSNEFVEKVVGYKVSRRTFDISQTDGKDKIPELTPELNGVVNNKEEILKSLENVSGIKFKYEDIQNGAKGYYKKTDDSIVIKSNMPDLQTIKTAIHETAHSMLHSESGIAKEAEVTVKEIQAESVAFMVSETLGLDVSDYSFPYIASWSMGQEDKLLAESFEIIRDTSNKILDEITKNTGLAQDINSIINKQISENKVMTL